MKVIVCIPAFNEEQTIGEVIDGIKKVMTDYSYEIIAINDGSTDNTKQVARMHGANVVSHRTKFGLAEAYRTGCREALERGADIVVTIDSDGQYSPEDVPDLLSPVIKNEADLVLGWRKWKEYMPLSKRMGNWLFARVVSFLAKKKIRDPQTGFRAFTKEIAKFKIISDFSYTQETCIKAARAGFKILEVPIHFKKRISGKSRLFSNPLVYATRATIQIFRMLRDYSPIKFFGTVGAGLILAGILIGIIFGHDLLALGCFLTGVSTLMFGFLADSLREVIDR